MSAKIPNFPVPVSQFIGEIVGAFRKRSKAIKHKVSDWRINISFDQGYERLDIDVVHLNEQIRLVVWDDGNMWFRVVQGTKQGWAVNYSFYAKADENSAANIIATFEESLVHSMNEEKVRSIWGQEFHG